MGEACHFTARSFELRIQCIYFVDDHDRIVGAGSVFNRKRKIKGSRGSSYITRTYKCSPLPYMHRGSFCEPHIPVKAATGIPAGRIGRVIEPDGQLILAAGLNIRRKIEVERVIAIRPAAY